ncbi:uncharacterized protein LOC120354124 [Nilaparvata lugens]|uniref:uncharacterized protein LOC120354124 n=1 Tax=Nilaparvata lugens TaxID=108931 RepID=UPI00193E608E|nr:uncharacterized protein LOC120354124 [Nilaparvata lugens]
MDIWFLCPSTNEEWESVMRGLEKSQIKYVIASAILVSPEPSSRVLNFIFLSIAFSCLTFFLFIGFKSMCYAWNDLLTLVELLHAYTFAYAVWFLLLVHYSMKMPILHEMFRMIDAGIFEYKTDIDEDKNNELRDTAKFHSNMFQKVFHLMCAGVFVIICVIPPVILKLFGVDGRGRVEEIDYIFAVPTWFPFNSKTFLGFCAAYLLLFIQVGLIFMYIAILVPFIVFGLLEISTEYNILKRSILSLEPRALEKYNSGSGLREKDVQLLRDDAFYEQCVQECLKENILHHIEILRFFNLYQDLTSTIYGVVIGLSMAILACLSLVLTKMDLFSFAAVKFGVFFIIELIAVFGYCVMGTVLTEVSKEIPKALYNCPWYNVSENNRRTLKIFQLNSEISIEIKGNGLFVIDLNLFVQIVQTTYSIFNIFASFEK